MKVKLMKHPKIAQRKTRGDLEVIHPESYLFFSGATGLKNKPSLNFNLHYIQQLGVKCKKLSSARAHSVRHLVGAWPCSLGVQNWSGGFCLITIRTHQ